MRKVLKDIQPVLDYLAEHARLTAAAQEVVNEHAQQLALIQLQADRELELLTTRIRAAEGIADSVGQIEVVSTFIDLGVVFVLAAEEDGVPDFTKVPLEAIETVGSC